MTPFFPSYFPTSLPYSMVQFIHPSILTSYLSKYLYLYVVVALTFTLFHMVHESRGFLKDYFTLLFLSLTPVPILRTQSIRL